jgi:hypothetical protein
MPLFFVDASGRQGRITDEFAVVYDGPIAVESYVRGIVTETTSDERAVEELILGMVDDLDVDEVRRVGTSAEPPRPPA